MPKQFDMDDNMARSIGFPDTDASAENALSSKNHLSVIGYQYSSTTV